MRLLLLAVTVLAIVSQAQAAPDGFRDSARLTPRMQAISGNPNAVVYCATSAEAFAAKRASYDSGSGAIPSAFTVYAESAAYFPPHNCAALERWLRGKTISRYDVGVAAQTFSHEAGHLGGVVDERTVECGALAKLAATLRLHFAVKNPVAIRAMVAAAKTRNARSSLRC